MVPPPPPAGAFAPAATQSALKAQVVLTREAFKTHVVCARRCLCTAHACLASDALENTSISTPICAQRFYALLVQATSSTTLFATCRGAREDRPSGRSDRVHWQRQDHLAPKGRHRALAAPVVGRGRGEINDSKYCYPIVCESAVRL